MICVAFLKSQPVLDMHQHLRLGPEILIQCPGVSFFAVDSDSVFIVDGSYRGP
jgi:hypothetical protein